jgi:hypothetical protein
MVVFGVVLMAMVVLSHDVVVVTVALVFVIS